MIQRQVIQLPLEEIWDGHGQVSRTRVRDLGARNIRNLLTTGPVHFVVADVAHPLIWVSLERCFDFWKIEVRARLLEPDAAREGVRLEELPGMYGYAASEWQWTGSPVVVLSKWH